MEKTEFLDKKLLYLFNKGEDRKSYLRMGAHKVRFRGEEGYNFLVWVPKVKAVYLVGDFNDWKETSPMEKIKDHGMWTLFVPNLPDKCRYKYLIITKDGKKLFKADPYAFFAEVRPKTASLTWDDKYKWMSEEKNKKRNHFKEPMNIYEIHLGSWKRHEDGTFYSYNDLAESLPEYLKDMNYTHVGFLPIMEHPYDGSWGYQLTGYFAPTSRFGEPKDFKHLIDELHRAGIHAILDWVPGHFCKDEHGLGRFNGYELFEKGEQHQWGTYKFNYDKAEVTGFLLSNICYWIEEYHIDGFRVDGISSMIYLNYGISDSNKKIYNKFGGEENLAAIRFLQKLNETIAKNYPSIYMIAEESTAWPLVTYPPYEGGLGFHYKWNMGWMHDTLNYFKLDFSSRKQKQDNLTFSTMYQYSENFILPLSHDEVVHGKFSLIERMPGSYINKFANLRTLYIYQMTHSGGKLNFMGNEIAQFIEWRYYEQIEWFLLDYDSHRCYRDFVRDTNNVYLHETSLWQQNYTYDGFKWIDADNSEQGVLIYLRQGKRIKDTTIIVLNLQPKCYAKYDIGVPGEGIYYEIINSDDLKYGGKGTINSKPIKTNGISKHYQKDSITIKLPALSGVIFKRR